MVEIAARIDHMCEKLPHRSPENATVMRCHVEEGSAHKGERWLIQDPTIVKCLLARALDENLTLQDLESKIMIKHRVGERRPKGGKLHLRDRRSVILRLLTARVLNEKLDFLGSESKTLNSMIRCAVGPASAKTHGRWRSIRCIEEGGLVKHRNRKGEICLHRDLENAIERVCLGE
jgi:hypothetical protein